MQKGLDGIVGPDSIKVKNEDSSATAGSLAAVDARAGPLTPTARVGVDDDNDTLGEEEEEEIADDEPISVSPDVSVSVDGEMAVAVDPRMIE